MPLTSPSAEVTTIDGVEEEDDGFERVDDVEGEPGDKVVISIPAKEVAKPEASGLAGKTLMFESEEEDDPEVKKQIEAVLDRADLLGDLILSEPEDESESESPDGDDGDEDLNETKRYYEGQEEGTGEPDRNRAVRKLQTPILLAYRRVPEIQLVPGQTPHPETPHRPNPKPPRARVPAMRVPAKLLLPNPNFQPRP